MNACMYVINVFFFSLFRSDYQSSAVQFSSSVTASTSLTHPPFVSPDKLTETLQMLASLFSPLPLSLQSSYICPTVSRAILFFTTHTSLRRSLNSLALLPSISSFELSISSFLEPSGQNQKVREALAELKSLKRLLDHDILRGTVDGSYAALVENSWYSELRRVTVCHYILTLCGDMMSLPHHLADSSLATYIGRCEVGGEDVAREGIERCIEEWRRRGGGGPGGGGDADKVGLLERILKET